MLRENVYLNADNELSRHRRNGYAGLARPEAFATEPELRRARAETDKLQKKRDLAFERFREAASERDTAQREWFDAGKAWRASLLPRTNGALANDRTRRASVRVKTRSGEV